MTGTRGSALHDPDRVADGLRAERAAETADARLRRTTELAARVLGVDVGFVSLVGVEHELLTAVVGPQAAAPRYEAPTASSLCRYLVLSGEPLLISDLSRHPELGDLAEVRATGLQAYAGTPLLSADGRVLGGLCVGHSTPRAWSPADAALLADLASAVESELQLRVAVAELRTMQQGERRHAEQQAALHRVAVLVAHGEPPAVVLQQVADELAGLLEVSAAAVLRFLPDGRAELAASAGLPSPDLAALSGCANALARVRGTAGPAVGEHGDVPCAAVPITVEGAGWGAVLALTTEATADGILAQLEALTDFISLVIVNAQAQQQLSELARSDSLTGVANRRAFDERLDEELHRAARYGHPLALLLLDVDHFKRTNDREGHDVGDRVLRELAGRVRQELRDGDLLARLGGDGFAVVLPETDSARAMVVADRVRHAVGDLSLAGLPVTVSAGVGVTAAGSTTRPQLFRAADAALYDAKAAGRNTVTLTSLD